MVGPDMNTSNAHGTVIGDVVFDPFMGSGTVAHVAQNLGRRWLGSELNPEYIALQSGRTRQQGLMLS
jgi:DNA modification methylase